MPSHKLGRWAFLAALVARSVAKPVNYAEHPANPYSESPLATTITAPEGEILISTSGLVVVVDATKTVTLATVDGSRFITHGVTFTLDGDAEATGTPPSTDSPSDDTNSGDSTTTEEDEDPPPDDTSPTQALPSSSSPPDDTDSGESTALDDDDTPGADDEGSTGASPSPSDMPDDADSGNPPLDDLNRDPGNPPEDVGSGNSGVPEATGGPPPQDDGPSSSPDAEGSSSQPEATASGLPPSDDPENPSNQPEATDTNEPPSDDNEGSSGQPEETGAPPSDDTEDPSDDTEDPSDDTEDPSDEPEATATGVPASDNNDGSSDQPEATGAPPSGNTEDLSGQPEATATSGPPPTSEDENDEDNGDEETENEDNEDENEDDDDDDDDDDSLIPLPLPIPDTGNHLPDPSPGPDPAHRPENGNPPSPEPEPEPTSPSEEDEEEDQETPDCSTETITTTVPCGETAAPATTTTTSVGDEPTRACSPNTCGGGSCSVSKRDISKRASQKSSQPPVCKWSEPENYANPADFMASEGSLSGNSPEPGSDRVFGVPLPIDSNSFPGTTSSTLTVFGDVPVTLATPRLVGCTTIIVISRKGTWANHMWEIPGFLPEKEYVEVSEEGTGGDSGGEESDSDASDIPGLKWSGKWYVPGSTTEAVSEFPAAEQRAFFQKHILDTLHAPYDPPTPHHTKGLDELRQPGNVFEDGSEPQVFMFAPYVAPRRGQDQFRVENPVGLPAAFDLPGRTDTRADEGGPSFNDQIRAELRSIFGEDLNIQMVLYAPDLVEDPFDDTFDNPRGRGLIQYQPGDGRDCEGSEARWRVFFERSLEPHAEATWVPADDQYCLPPVEGNAQNRLLRRQACGSDEPEPSALTPTPTHTPVPTLPPVTELDSREGSSCASTVTVDQCNRAACVPMPLCASWVATAAATPTAELQPQVTSFPVRCWLESELPGHADIDRGDMIDGARKFCESEDAPETMDASSEKYVLNWTNKDDVNYDYQVFWAPGCVTESGSQNIQHPTETGPNCVSSLGRTYDKCENGGIGGSITQGCLVYEFMGGKSDN
ncbi:uncharacterized protein DNG_05149 [Cephalotrichum gorgonifer]|uniref:Uncharacterized protein n=1 Tax=Cephalotrichum gorgonifer TaxID=2041049 RepID=A0AAE8SV95_9PEZI|nr:uncharacterized protein DNG_05149 [Cephalotrichum gorgonifer]